MARYEAGEITKNGVTVPITVDEQGRWSAAYAGSNYWADTRAALEVKIAKAVKGVTAKVSIPFTRRGPNGRIARGIATGIHSGNGNILVQWQDGGKEQLPPGGVVIGELTADEITEWADLTKRRDQAIEAVRRFEIAHRLYLSQVVKDAIEVETARMQGESE